MTDNLKKDSKVEGKDNPETWTPPEGQEWLNEKFSKAEKPVEAQAKGYAESEKKLREVEAERNKIEAELNEMKSGGVTTFDDAMKTRLEDELAALKAENDGLKKPKSNLSAEQEAQVKNWHSRLASEDPIISSRAFLEGVRGEIYGYDQKRKTEDQRRSFDSQMKEVAGTHTKEKLDELAPYVYRIRKERPDLERSEHGVYDILDKAKVRLAEDKKALEVDAEAKTKEKEQIGSTGPTETEALTKEIKWEDIDKMSIPEREQFLRDQGIKFV